MERDPLNLLLRVTVVKLPPHIVQSVIVTILGYVMGGILALGGISVFSLDIAAGVFSLDIAAGDLFHDIFVFGGVIGSILSGYYELRR